MKKSLPQSNALHLTAPPLRGGGNGGGKILRIRAPFCLLRRHFPYQGNHPALPYKMYVVRVVVGNARPFVGVGVLDDPLFLPLGGRWLLP